MKILNGCKFLALAGAMFVISATAAYSQSTLVDFDHLGGNGPTFLGADDYQAVTSGGIDGPTFVTSEITFTGGVVLNGAAHFDNLQTTDTNLYASAVANVGNLQFTNNETDGGTNPLPGIITGTLTTPGKFTGVNLDIINSVAWNSFVTFTAYDSANDVVAQLPAVQLIGFNYDGDLNQVFNVTLTGSNIAYFTLFDTIDDANSTGDLTAAPGLAIDTVTLSTPEPSTWMGLVVGGLLLAVLMIRTLRKANRTSEL